VTRADGLPVWIYQFRLSPSPTIPTASPDEMADVSKRFADAVPAIWQGWVQVDRFNELVLRAGLTWQQVVILRAYAKYLRQAGFPYSQAHIEKVINDNAGTARSLVELFEAVFDPAAGLRTPAPAIGEGAAPTALPLVDPDAIESARAGLPQASSPVSLAAGRFLSLSMQITLP